VEFVKIENEEINEISKDGAEIPFLRPKELMLY